MRRPTPSGIPFSVTVGPLGALSARHYQTVAVPSSRGRGRPTRWDGSANSTQATRLRHPLRLDGIGRAAILPTIRGPDRPYPGWSAKAMATTQQVPPTPATDEAELQKLKAAYRSRLG